MVRFVECIVNYYYSVLLFFSYKSPAEIETADKTKLGTKKTKLGDCSQTDRGFLLGAKVGLSKLG